MSVTIEGSWGLLVPPSKPDSVSLVQTQADSPVPTTKHMDYSTSSQSTTVTPTENEIVTASANTEQNTTTVFNHSSIQKTYHNTSSSTPSNDDLSSEFSYRTTTFSTQQTTIEKVLAEGDYITVVCSGDVGKPQQNMSFKNNVRTPTVTKHPNKQIYIVSADTSITLPCTSDGNPKPSYRWYKDSLDDKISIAANFTLRNINTTDRGIYTCNVSNTINGLTYTDVASIEVNIMNEADKTTTESTSTGSSSGANDINENSSGNIGMSSYWWCSGAAVSIIMIIVITYCVFKSRKKTSETLLQSESQSFDVFESKSNAESMTGNNDFIAMEKGTNKTQSVNNGHEVVREHNEEYLRIQKEEEEKKNESNSSLQPAVYADMNEATKLQNKQQNTETMELAVKQHEGSTVESQEGINDEAGDKSHIENEDDEHLDTSNISSQQNRNSYTELSNQTSQTGCYNTQASEEDENRKVATVSPTIHSSDICQDNEQTNQNCHSQSKEGYENIIDKDQSDTLEDDNSHRTAL
ncbi:MUSK [Mytilus edulis]|uniref:MUSK n=1 Tax=Mytilus edulis TaxID=6550 RepID=A0A8S3R4G0_MYTED|nr:MUSK [Mytilus edulis]